MIISSTEERRWRPGVCTDDGGIELVFGEQRQKIRGFGCCFSELSAKAFNELPGDAREEVFKELFGEEGCNFNRDMTFFTNPSMLY